MSIETRLARFRDRQYKAFDSNEPSSGIRQEVELRGGKPNLAPHPVFEAEGALQRAKARLLDAESVPLSKNPRPSEVFARDARILAAKAAVEEALDGLEEALEEAERG